MVNFLAFLLLFFWVMYLIVSCCGSLLFSILLLIGVKLLWVWSYLKFGGGVDI